jgi:hypothetical protein
MKNDVRFAFPVTAFIILNPPVRLGPFAGRQNPTCGTGPFFGVTRVTENLHGISLLRRATAFGTVVAKDPGVIDPHHALPTSKF